MKVGFKKKKKNQSFPHQSYTFDSKGNFQDDSEKFKVQVENLQSHNWSEPSFPSPQSLAPAPSVFLFKVSPVMNITINPIAIALINHTLANMAPSVSVFISIALLFCGMYLNSIGELVEVSDLSSLELEAKALLKSGWWSAHTNNTSTRCKYDWPSVTCNAARSVTKIDLANRLYVDKLNLNFSSIPNLVYLDLHMTRLKGSIPLEIGTLSKLTYLDLSNNNLTGELPLSLANLTQLKRFDISFNQIIGPIPSSLSFNQPHPLGNVWKSNQWFHTIRNRDVEEFGLFGPQS
jgi:hypothetical protein